MTDVTTYRENFDQRADGLPGGGNESVRQLRRNSIAAFEEHGFPTQKVEAWHFTGLNPLSQTDFALTVDVPDSLRDAQAAPPRLDGTCRLSFVDGRFLADWSDTDRLPEGVEILSLQKALDEGVDWVVEALGEISVEAPEDALLALNTALMTDGAVIRIGKDAQVDVPIHLHFFKGHEGGAQAQQLRTLIVAEPNSRAEIIETWEGPTLGLYWSNAATQIVVGEGAELTRYKLQDDSLSGFHTTETSVTVAGDGRYGDAVLMTGSRIARHEVNVVLNGEGAHADLRGVSLGSSVSGQGQMLDTTTKVTHASGGATSEQLYKSVLAESARAAFQGKVIVAKDAQKTEAHQANHNLLLDRTAEADSKPELEIFADDVQCSHGATVGEMDEDALFYLRSRGLSERDAKGLLVEGFVREVFDPVANETVRDLLEERIVEWLRAREGGKDAA